jgi:hypothetical protein
LRRGEVDIVIGTHRLLSGDVAFKDLGLVIIDEEQRFGVAHKEKLKKLRYSVDVLTMTATPIPRTLHMALAGARNLSLIETPPEDRFPVQTYVVEYSPEMVREAIRGSWTAAGRFTLSTTASLTSIVLLTISSSWYPRRGWVWAMARWMKKNWKRSCWTLSKAVMMCWCVPPLLKTVLISPTSIP